MLQGPLDGKSVSQVKSKGMIDSACVSLHNGNGPEKWTRSLIVAAALGKGFGKNFASRDDNALLDMKK